MDAEFNLFTSSNTHLTYIAKILIVLTWHIMENIL